MNAIPLFKPLTMIVLSALALSACGGSDDSDSKALTGVFIDAPVQGLGYQTPSHQGTTNAKGEFSYEANEEVTFYFNGIDLGSEIAQAQFPVTLLPNSLKLAQLLQTLDHDANPDRIDVSGIKLGATVKGQVMRSLANKAGSLELNDIFSDARLADLQASNNVNLVNQTLVDEAAAIDHLLDNIELIAFKTRDFSNKLILDGDGVDIGSDPAVLTFNASGTGEFLGPDEDGFFLDIKPVSWSLNNNGTANIVFSDSTVTGTKFSESGNRSTVHIGDGDDELIREWRTALPLSLAAVDGKHFAVDFGDGCASTLSFNGSTATQNSDCTVFFNTRTFQASDHDLLDNVIVLTITFPEDFLTPASSLETELALIDGNLTEGKYVLIDSYTYPDEPAFDSSEISIVQASETDAALLEQ